MKTKLLKRLRRKAKKRYYVTKGREGGDDYNVNIHTAYYFHIAYTHETKEDAIEHCDARRRGYITDYIYKYKYARRRVY